MYSRYSIPTPLRFHSLYALGCIFFLLNIVLFLFNITMISLRFYLYPSTFRASFLHPTESLFIPAAVISFGTILINISQYGVGQTGPWLEDVMIVLYWVDLALAVLFSSGIYLVMWSTQTFTISKMTPVWIFPAYPLLIVGPHAGNLSKKLALLGRPTAALDVIVGGFTVQGIGFMVSVMIYSAFLYRLMTQKLPPESLRPGMFISVGPSGFTIAGVILMGQQLPSVVPKDFMGEGLGELAGNVSKIAANWVGLWLWGLALWWFLASIGAHFSCVKNGKMDFAMTWYSFVFPNTALTTATFAVAQALGRQRAIEIVGCVMTVGLIVTWFFVFGMMIRAVVLKQILWPQMQEDRNEGGWCEKCGHGLSHGYRVSQGRPPAPNFFDHFNPATPLPRDEEKGIGGVSSRVAEQDWKTVAWKGQQRDAQPMATGTSAQLRSEPEHLTEGPIEQEKVPGEETNKSEQP